MEKNHLIMSDLVVKHWVCVAEFLCTQDLTAPPESNDISGQ